MSQVFVNVYVPYLQLIISLKNNSETSQRTKHIDLRYFHARDLIQSNKIKVQHCPTELNHADILTKALPANLFLKHCSKLLQLRDRVKYDDN